MNRAIFAISMLAVVAVAAWAYHVNYLTKNALGKVDRLRVQITAERETAEVLRVEWAYLNAPERLARLVGRKNDELALVALGPDHFDEVASVPYPSRGPFGAPLSDLPLIGDSARVSDRALIVISEPLPAVGQIVPLPAPRPAGWRSQ